MCGPIPSNQWHFLYNCYILVHFHGVFITCLHPIELIAASQTHTNTHITYHCGWMKLPQFRFQDTENNVDTRVTNCFSAHERVILVFISRVAKLFPELRINERNKYQNNPLVSTETVRHESTYIISFLIRHHESINDEEWRSLHIVPVPHLSGLRSADDVTIDSWWHHND